MITIVDYSNSGSQEIAECVRQITDAFIVSKNEIDICRADKIIFPGTGSAPEAIRELHLLNLFSVLRIVRKPMLGIGLGMQLMSGSSKEGNISCLGIFPGTFLKFENGTSPAFNEGLQQVSINKESKLFAEIPEQSEFYFKHSYYLPENPLTTSVSKHKVEFSSSIEKNSSFGVQFHPEKSGEAGMKLLKNFCDL
jgi:imidazole glycerol-phosphate synthase subunit HisH